MERHATHPISNVSVSSSVFRTGHTLRHLNYPLHRSALTASGRGAVRPSPTAKENQPHGQHLPPPSARPRLRSWALPPSEGWPAVPVACGPLP